MTNKKYSMIRTDKTTPDGKPLFQIKAKADIAFKVKKGELGGYIEKEENLSSEGNAWVSGDAQVYGNARVSVRANITTSISVELPRITLDSQKKLDMLLKTLNKLKEA